MEWHRTCVKSAKFSNGINISVYIGIFQSALSFSFCMILFIVLSNFLDCMNLSLCMILFT